MGKKKKNELTAEGAQLVLDEVTSFEKSSKGRHDRAHFGSIIVQALDNHVLTRDDLLRASIKKEVITKAYNTEATRVSASQRSAVIHLIRETIAKKFPALEAVS